MKTQIKNRYTNAVLFECEVPEDIESGMHIRHALEKACESGADLINANLSNANLSNANLSNADLINADLSNADLSNADLSDANLSNANLSYANLSNANLSNAYLSYANLSNANLSNELKLSGDRPFFSVGPIGSRSDVLHAYTTDKGLQIRAGCFFGAIGEFRAKLINTHGENVHREEYEAALLLIEKHMALWPAEVSP